MFTLKRNQIIITALVIMICVAGYLNYVDSRENITVSGYEYEYGLTPTGEVSALVMDHTTGQEIAVVNTTALYADGEVAIALYNENNGNTDNTDGEDEVDVNESEPGTAIFVNAASDSSFFIQAKLDREQDRSKQKETLTALINAKEIDENTKAQCAGAILELQEKMEKESATETALQAKGFGDAYVRIDGEWIDVIINATVLTDQELAQLEDIVTRHTGASLQQIRVSSVKQR